MNQPARILLVDDDVSIQRAVAPLLRSRGYHVEVVGTGAEGVAAAADRAPDLIVLDLGLPDLEGAEVCRRMREHTKAPIVILSARSGEAEKVAALDLGADDYVTKPFGAEELLARIRVALRRVSESEAPALEQVHRRRSDDRLRPPPRRPRRRGHPADAQGVRAPRAARAQRRSRPDASRDPEGDLGTERRRPARASLGADGAAAQEDRARSGHTRATSSASRGSGTGW